MRISDLSLILETNRPKPASSSPGPALGIKGGMAEDLGLKAGKVPAGRTNRNSLADFQSGKIAAKDRIDGRAGEKGRNSGEGIPSSTDTLLTHVETSPFRSTERTE